MSAAWLEGDLTTMALCWRIVRRDGIGLGLTAHDRNLTIDGNVFRAAPGMTPSAIKRGDGAEASALEVAGQMSSSAIAEADLVGGRWDGAAVAVFAVDWTDPTRRVALGGGTVGAVETKDGAFAAELRGAGALLDRPVTEETSPTCRATLGDARCRVAMAGRRAFARVVSIDDEVVTLNVAEPVANGWGEGRLRWLGGANGGLEDAVALSAGAAVTLRSLPRFAVAAGDRVEMIEGCDKMLATCATRFANAVNFRGEPYLPGIDLLTRYPGG